MSDNRSTIASNWPGFRRLWMIVTLLLILLLLILWLRGYGPGSNQCQTPPEIVEKVVETEIIKEVESPQLLSRIDELMRENSQIPELVAKISALESAEPKTVTKEVEKIVDNPELLKQIEELRRENQQLEPLRNKIAELDNKLKEAIKAQSVRQTLSPESTKGKNQDSQTDMSRPAIQQQDDERVDDSTPRMPVAPSAPPAPAAPALQQQLNQPSPVPEITKQVSTKQESPKQEVKITKTDAENPTAEKPAMQVYYFDVGSAAFPEDPNLRLGAIVSYLMDNEKATVTIGSYHMPSDDKALQQQFAQLAYRRSETISQLFKQVGIAPGRIKLDQPKAIKSNVAMKESRRVEVSIEMPE